MYHPSRGGVRGGRDQFNWDDVKGDKHRENYLGHSVKAPVGRWQKGKDLYWYTKEHGSEGPSKDEIKRIQEEEEDAMKEMLGLAPRKNRRPQGRLDKREVDELLKKGKSEEELAPAYVDGERVQGLGFAPAPGQTGGQSGGNRTIDVKPPDVSLPLERPSGADHVEEADKDATQRQLPPSKDREASLSVKNRAASSEDEAADRKKRKEEKRKARELRSEAKRARKEAKKASRDEENDRERESPGHRRREDGAKRSHEATSLSHHRQMKDRSGREPDSVEDAVRFSARQSHRRTTDYISSSDGESSKHRMRFKRTKSPEKGSVPRNTRHDADRGRQAEDSSISRDNSCFDWRHKRERQEYSPVQTHQKHRRHDSDSERDAERHHGDRQKKQTRQNISSYTKQRRDSPDSDKFVRRREQRSLVTRVESAVRRSEKQRRHDSEDEEYENHRGENQRRMEEQSPARKSEKYRRHDSDTEERGTRKKKGLERGIGAVRSQVSRRHDSDSD